MNPRHEPWDAGEQLLIAERVLLAARMLHRKGVFPTSQSRCLEVGYGRIGWLGHLLSWGVAAASLHGIELDPERAAVARENLPGADLRVGDAERMPWPDGHFQLIIASTVFTSILDRDDRKTLAGEILRVLAPGGALLIYDFRVDSPGNDKVRRLSKKEILDLFPDLSISIRSLSLAPPLARSIGGWSPRLAAALTLLPVLRTHLLTVGVKPGPASRT